MSPLQYDLEREDMVAFADHHASNAPHLVRRTRRMRWIWVAILATAALAFLPSSLVLAVTYAILALVSFALYPRWMRWWHRRYQRRLYQNSGPPLFGHCELTLDNDQLHARSAAGESHIHFSAIDRVESNPDYLFVYLGPAQAVVIPKHRVSSGDVEALALELKKAGRSPAA